MLAYDWKYDVPVLASEIDNIVNWSMDCRDTDNKLVRLSNYSSMLPITSIYSRHISCLYHLTCKRHRQYRRRFFTTKLSTSTPAETVTATNPSTTGSNASSTLNTAIHQNVNDNDGIKNTGHPAIAEIHKGPAVLLTSHSIRSRPQPNLLYIPGLRSLPFWTQQQIKQHHHQQETIEESMTNRVAYGDPTVTAIVEHFDKHYATIWQEYLSNHYNDTNIKTTYVNSNSDNGSPLPTENLQSDSNENNSNVSKGGTNEHDMHLLNQGGKWDWHSYMTKGNVLIPSPQISSFQQTFPQTSSILEALRSNSTSDTTNFNPFLRNQLLEHVPFGYVFFSTLHEQTQILPHTSPINFRLRIHVPLYVPKQTAKTQLPPTLPDERTINKPTCGIRVGKTIREWHTGKSLVLDDSYEHEVWNDHPQSATPISPSPNHHHTQNQRVVLLVDIWHPDITHDEREEICYMFQTAKDQGWLST